MNLKKLLTVLLALSLMPMGAFAAAFVPGDFTPLSGATILSNAGEYKSLDLKHKVSRKSSFSVAQQTELIQETGATTIATMNVINNTKDGYTVSVQSEEGGVLTPDDTLDGELPIAYGLVVTHTGIVGVGITALEDIVSADLADSTTPHEILSGGEQSSPTDAKFSVDLDINVSLAAQMTMAGTYTDTVTFTYQDE
jgi:hypothetical protein